MKKTIVITDVTQMPAGDQVCVVGIDAEGKTIRPVCEGGFLKEYLYDPRKKVIIRHGAKVEFDLYPVATEPPHIEDMGFEPKSIVGRGLCNSTDWESVLRASIFETVEEVYEGFLRSRSWVAPGAKTRSIATLYGAKIVDVKLTSRTVKPRITFVDSTGYEFDRPSSDLTLWERCFSMVKRHGLNPEEVEKDLVSLLQKSKKLYLRIGLARPWEEDNKCWLQVTGVYTFPDYLDGKCFDDFKR